MQLFTFARVHRSRPSTRSITATRGDGKADLWRTRHAVRYVTYGLIVPLIFWLGLAIHPVLWLLYGVGGGLYLRQPYRRLWVVLDKAQSTTLMTRLHAIALIPVIRVTGDIAKMLGYPVGVWWRFITLPRQRET